MTTRLGIEFLNYTNNALRNQNVNIIINNCNTSVLVLIQTYNFRNCLKLKLTKQINKTHTGGESSNLPIRGRS